MCACRRTNGRRGHNSNVTTYSSIVYGVGADDENGTPPPCRVGEVYTISFRRAV